MTLCREKACRAGLALLLASLPASCSAPARNEVVILSVQTGPGAQAGPIQGKVRCEGEAGDLEEPCLPEDLTLAEAVLACGPAEATIDRGSSHRLFVHFPAGMRERFPALPSDVEIVRCVQARIGFAFDAGVAAGGSALIDADPAPFASLHSRRG